jgi:hypothetical protein
MRGKELQGNLAVQLSILGQIDFPHPPGTDLLDYFIVSDNRATDQCHMRPSLIVVVELSGFRHE